MRSLPVAGASRPCPRKRIWPSVGSIQADHGAAERGLCRSRTRRPGRASRPGRMERVTSSTACSMLFMADGEVFFQVCSTSSSMVRQSSSPSVSRLTHLGCKLVMQQPAAAPRGRPRRSISGICSSWQIFMAVVGSARQRRSPWAARCRSGGAPSNGDQAARRWVSAPGNGSCAAAPPV